MGRAILCLLLGFSGAFQISLALDYERAWQQMSSFMGQMSRCAPALQPGTLLLYEEPFIDYYPANSLAALVNWTYAPDSQAETQPYDVFRVSERLGNALPQLAPDIPIRHGAFQGSTSRMLVIMLDEEGCLRFLQAEDTYNESLFPWLRQAARLSNLEVIDSHPARAATPPAFMQPELIPEECRLCDLLE